MSECCGNGCGCHPEGEPEKEEACGKIKLEYLQHTTEIVATLNANKEHELKPTKYLNRGDLVWVIQPDDSFIKYEII